ncbi:Amidohydrolase family, putative [Synechococcus sp. PCC 7335]|uniref:amidohydrolase family protein n=1 Tax=Synechococcus sp. (strain ATCC 29403 / PCC 7335) TaxID=91464 RepID=UPI00017EB52A|nr:amidohydrolase family protein [Synechococcus sp. PCC 7335]EDX82931.1 Amidohydrolase family, putative [Synechococcus sp. PCC 7335]
MTKQSQVVDQNIDLKIDLKIENAALANHSEQQTIAIHDGLIKDISPIISAPAARTFDAKGNLVIPGLIDPHLHLDKAFLLEQSPAKQGTFQEALEETLRLKKEFTIEDIQARARRVINNAIAFGITAIRSHVEVDPVLKLTSIKALLPLQQEYAQRLTLQLAIFAQEGITNQPGTEQLLHEALTLGGDVIGSAPYTDPDPERNINIVFDLAQTFNCDVDFHLDFLDDDEPLLFPIVARETIKRGWQNRVCLGHMTRLAGLEPAALKDAAALLQEAGISVLALPASDLYMMARQDTHNVRRGVAPVQTLSDWGVNCAIATNNIQNLFTPFGDGDPLKICTLLAQVLQLGTRERHALCLAMATTHAAKAIGIANHRIAAGNRADLVVLNAHSPSQIIGDPPCNRTNIKSGKIVSQTRREQVFS